MKKQNKTYTYDLSDQGLLDAALRYLGRYAASRTQVRRVLARRFLRAGVPEGRAAIENVLTRLEAQGLIDDAAFAARHAARLRAAGRSARVIAQKLATKGIARADQDSALKQADAEDEESELNAARLYAQKKKLGLFGERDADSAEELRARRHKEMARMARAGFSQDVVRRVLGEG